MANLIDIYDEQNQPTGETSEINDALLQGLWTRGAHVVLCTKTGYVLVQKRSTKMIMRPGLLDISLNGYVDSGETPEQAAVREIREETGIAVDQSQLHFVSMWRQNRALPKMHKHTRVFGYLYVAVLPTHESVVITNQKSEVAWSVFVPFRKAKRLVRLHYIKGLGRLEPTYGFYKEALVSAKKVLAES